MPIKRSIAIVGSRTYPIEKELYSSLTKEEQDDYDLIGSNTVADFMDNLTGGRLLTIVSGGAKGPDTWAAEIAREKGFNLVEIRPNWKKYGKAAGFRRNTEIVQAADDVVAFWDLFSNGTFDSIKKATEFHKDVMVFGPDGTMMMAFTQEDYAREKIILPTMAIPKTRH